MTRTFRSAIAAVLIGLLPNVAFAASGMSTYLQNKEIDAIFTRTTFTPATTLYVGLFTTCPTANNTTGAPGTEVSVTSTGYGRQAVTSNATNWASTGGATTTTNPSAGTSGTTSNNGAVTYGAPSGASLPVTVVCAGIFDAATTGNLYFWGALTVNKTINSGDAAPSFAISALTVQISLWLEAHPAEAELMAMHLPFSSGPVNLGTLVDFTPANEAMAWMFLSTTASVN